MDTALSSKVAPYSLPVMVMSPGVGSPETRLIDRLAAGTGFAREVGHTEIVICLNRADYRLYAKAHPGQIPANIQCDGAPVLQIDEGGMSYFRGRDCGGQMVAFPVLTDEQYREQLTLKPGMYVLLAKEMTPRVIEADPVHPNRLRINGRAYNTKAKPLSLRAPAIDYVWDKDAMEDKAERGLLSPMELTLFSQLMTHRLEDFINQYDTKNMVRQ